VADSPISGSGMTVREVFSGHRYRLDQYQRDYSWRREEIRMLVDDLHRRFQGNYLEIHDRKRVATYDPYFLGSFVYHEDEGITYVVDGQQRITTLHVLLIYLQRLLTDADLPRDAVALDQLIRTTEFGEVTFTVDISDRTDLLEHLFDESQEIPSNEHPSARALWKAADELDACFPDELRGDALPYFVDWLLKRVCMVGIKAANHEQGWEIYESVNDRGVRLSPLDLLKSLLLRNLVGTTDGVENTWRTMISGLAAVEPNEPVRFIKAFLIALYAPDQRAVEAIERNFYEWFRASTDQIGLVKPGHYRDLMTAMSTQADHYRLLAAASRSFDEQLKCVFFNSFNRITGQFAPILTVLTDRDSRSALREKAALIAGYLDLVYVWRFVSGQRAAEDDMAVEAHRLVFALRGASTAAEVKCILGQQIQELEYGFAEMDTFGLQGSNKRQVRYLLARLTSYVDTGCGKQDHSSRYLAETEPYEIEHVWANRFERHQSTEIPNKQVFEAFRNRLGALVLLPKSANASFRDDPYEQKVQYYMRHNELAASLYSKHRERNSKFGQFVREIGLDKQFRAYTRFDRNAIEERQRLYTELCARIWDTAQFGVRREALPQAADPAVRRTRARFDVALRSLITAGLLDEHQELIGRRRKETFTARLTPDGSIRVESGESFAAPSPAGQFVLGTQSCQGWNFWKALRGDKEIPLSEIRRHALESGTLDSAAP